MTLLLTFFFSGSLWANVYSQPSIDEGDYEFVKIVTAKCSQSPNETCLTFELCNEEPVDCKPLGQGTYTIQALEAYPQKEKQTPPWVLTNDILSGIDVVLKEILIDDYLTELAIILSDLDTRP